MARSDDSDPSRHDNISPLHTGFRTAYVSSKSNEKVVKVYSAQVYVKINMLFIFRKKKKTVSFVVIQ